MAECSHCDADHVRGSAECPGQRLGRTVANKYKLIGLIGVGGMGAVYEAEHLTLKKQVALKMLHARYSGNPRIALRFHREAQKVAALGHPGIVDVRDFGQDADGCPFLEMELLRGQGVDELLQHGPLPIERALEITVQALDALAAAHAQGIVHRDLKPGNLFWAHSPHRGDHVKILDFGIAKVIDDLSDTGLTQPGALLGSPRYMSPDQIKDAAHVDHRGDLYSMGAILYEMLTGQSPASGATVLEVMARVARGEVEQNPRKRRPQVPEWLDGVVEKALAREPELRYQSALEMKQALERGQKRHGTEAAEPPAPAARPVAERTLELGTDGAAVPALVPAPPKPPVARAAQRAGTGPVRRMLLLAGGLALVASGVVWGFRILRPPPTSVAQELPRTAPRQAPAHSVGAPPKGMRLIPGGLFSMGSREDEIAAAYAWCQRLAGAGCRRDVYEREQPQRRVTLSPFFLDATEVTNAAFAAWLNGEAGLSLREDRFVEEGGVLIADLHPAHSGLVHRAGHYEPREGLANRPIVQVSWSAAERYCQAHGGRLPTEAQWEWAARGPGGRRFAWGEDDPACAGVVHARAAGQMCAAASSGPAEVGSASQDRSAEGVHDLAGNVAEWVLDRFVDRYDTRCQPSCVDPVAGETAATHSPAALRVVRGGAWNELAEACRAAGRSRLQEDLVQINVGFRCAAPVPAP
ncbi:MAG TPA: bifunctional serine/threonine-protein kinase/formylglycine-generating enzyme family protein [Polyangia bacterium]|nr:bifunctional serine/threonine-protein kinase/formylglycine-generating enzyme family protein [Polyangia bacterium]